MPQDMLSNPITPPYLTGVSATKGNGLFKLTPYTYPYQYSLTASQVNLQDTVTISNDADFVLQGLAIPSSAGLFSLQISDSRLYYLSQTALLSTLYSTDPANPWPFIGDYDTDTQAGGVWFPAGGRINLVLNDLSAASNTGEIWFIGCKRFALA